MDNIAIMTDSNSGITQEQALDMGIRVLPMPFLIDGETCYEDISLTQEAFYKKMSQDVEISTSQPSPDAVMTAWDELLKEFDSIVYIPMSSGLSGSCQTAKLLAQDYDGRVQVVDNQRISVTQKQSVMDAAELAAAGKTAQQICEYLEKVKLESSIYIMLDTLKYLKKGGRITPAAAALGSALRLKPILQIQGEKLDAFTVARTKKQGVSKMLAAMEEDVEKRFGGMANAANIHFAVAHTENAEAAEAFSDEVRKRFGVQQVDMVPLSLSISCHIGPGSLAIACSKGIDV